MGHTTKVYGGRASITFHEGRHRYDVDIPGLVRNLWQPSVTGIIGKLDKSGALVTWAVRMMSARVKQLVVGQESVDIETLHGVLEASEETWRKAKDDAANIGSLAHRVLEQELLFRAGLGKKPVLPLVHNSLLAPNLTEEMIEKANNSVKAGYEFFDTRHIEVVAAEAVRWSPTHAYLGTADLFAKVDGELAVIDFKTGLRLYPTVWLQLAAYLKAYEEEFPEQKVIRRIGVNIGRDGVLDVQERDNTTLESDFAAFLALNQIFRWDCAHDTYKPKPAPKVIGPLHLALAGK